MAKNVAQFINQAELNTYTSIDPNIQLTKLVPHIQEAQDEFLQNVLGTFFYYKLSDQIIQFVQTGLTSSFSPNYQTFIDNFCSKIVIHGTMVLALPWIGYSLKTKGIFTGASEAGTFKPLKDYTELSFLMDKEEQHVQFYIERARRELSLFTWKYPDYVNFAIQQNMFPDRRERYGVGVAIPKTGTRTQNQQYGRPLEEQGMSYINSVTGVDLAMEMYGPSYYAR